MCFAQTAQVHVQRLKDPLQDIIPIFRPSTIVSDSPSNEDELISNNIHVDVEPPDINHQEFDFSHMDIVCDFEMNQNDDTREERNNSNNNREDSNRFVWCFYVFAVIFVLLFIAMYLIAM